MVTFCTTVSRQALAGVRLLARRLRAHHPGARVIACVLDSEVGLSVSEPFEVCRLGELEASDPYAEDSTARVSRDRAPAILLGRALEEGAEVAVYLEPQVMLYSPLESVLAAAREHGLVLARRVERLPEDGERPNQADLIVAGWVTPACVAAAGAVGRQFASWWDDGIRQAGTPARWLELAGQRFPGIGWLDDPGCNVSFWNLHERVLEKRSGRVVVDGQPLRFIDFSGFRPDRPYVLGELPTRVRPLDDPVLAELCGEYAELLQAEGWQAPLEVPGSTARFGNGLPMTPLLQHLWAVAEGEGQRFGDPASFLAADAFASWLREPAPAVAATGVNRYLYAAYESDAGLRSAFPDLKADADELIAWAWSEGLRRLDLCPELLPGGADPSGKNAHLTVNVFGYLRDTLGLAEAARLYVTALDAAHVPVTTTAVAPDLPVSPGGGKTVQRFGTRVHEKRQASYEPSFNLVCLNGDQLAAFVAAGGANLLGDRITIGQWAWETDVLPPSWLPGFESVDEIWVNSTYVAENLGRLSPVPVVVIPQAMTVPDVTGVSAKLLDGRFTFLFLFDFFSTLQRKNPLGLIDAFTRAFAPDEGPRLLLKTINQQFRAEASAKLRERIGDRKDIDVVDRFLEPVETAALISGADCYVSLHRSEGFGLTLAEAMALGTPVIATGYSGNLDFTTERNSYLVDWRPTQVGPHGDVYPADGMWAEPDVEHAARLMRRVWEAPAEADEKARRARLDIEQQYSPLAAGSQARARLEVLSQRRHEVRLRRPTPLEVIEKELMLDLRRGKPTSRPGGDLARRLALRLMLPFTIHERRLDEAVLDALRDLRLDLERERGRGARARARLRRLEAIVSSDAERHA